MSMGASPNHMGRYEILDSRDQNFIETTMWGKGDAWSEYVPEAIEEHLQRNYWYFSANFDTPIEMFHNRIVMRAEQLSQ